MEAVKKGPEKSKEEILAERKAKKAEKAAKKSQPVVKTAAPVAPVQAVPAAVLEPPQTVKEISMFVIYMIIRIVVKFNIIRHSCKGR
jgi:hypothetical protein